jgi:MinD-like ATPase involved in chromosome partitioning or flagellar assembly
VSVVALCTPAGSSGVTTSAVLAAAMAPTQVAALAAECDPSGGDIAAWAQLASSPGWSTAVAGSDRSWGALLRHAQELPSGLRVLVAPSRAAEAAAAVDEAARAFASVLASLPEAIVFADCGRVGSAPPVWATRAQLTLLLIRQVAQSAPATVAVVDRSIEALELLRSTCARVGVVLVGGAPYAAREIESALDVPLFASLPDDRAGASAVSGAWAFGRRAARSPLAHAAGELAARVVSALPAIVVTPPASGADPPTVSMAADPPAVSMAADPPAVGSSWVLP